METSGPSEHQVRLRLPSYYRQFPLLAIEFEVHRAPEAADFIGMHNAVINGNEAAEGAIQVVQ